MKLKKIASLMLAGVMAVSMLAGCNGSSNNGNSENGEEVTTPSTGISAAFNEALSQKAKNLVKFADDTKLNSALAKVVAGISENDVKTAYQSGVNYDSDLTVKIAAPSALDCKTTLQVIDEKTDKAVTTVAVFTAGQGMTDSGIVDAVVNQIENLIEEFPTEGGKDVTNSYTYAGSVSITSKTFTNNNGVVRTVKYVAVSVTQTPTKISNDKPATT